MKKITKLLFALTASTVMFSCTEDIDTANRYTFTGETMADYIKNRPEQFSHMHKIYEQANMLGLLQTYGNYTLFLADNAAVERFLFEQDSIWQATKDSEEPIYTGITSPYVEELSDSMAVVIAQNHLIPRKYEVADMSNGVLETQNYNNRYVGVNIEGDETGFKVYINQSVIKSGDEEVVNGVVHILGSMLSLSNSTVSSQLSKYEYFSLFSKALDETAWADSLANYIDPDYKLGNEPAMGFDYIMGNGRYPHHRYYKYTIFAETDAVFAEAGIYTFEDLVAFAEKWYGTEAQGDFKNPANALHQFVGYHLLPCEVPYNKLVMHNMKHPTFESEKAFVPNVNRYDYFATMNNRLLKVLKPITSLDADEKQNIWINPSHKTIPDEMSPHLDLKIYNISDFVKISEEYAEFEQNALNGTIHPISGILIYNEDEMKGNVLNERMRFDFASILPELMTNNVRYCPKEEVFNEGSAAAAGDYVVPDGFCKNLKINNPTTNVHYMTPWTWGCNYLGDEFIANGKFDFEYRLPPVPDGTYELRIGYTATEKRSIVQFYVNGKITGIPVDLQIGAKDPRIGWKEDTGDIEANDELDKSMRNRGYMKAPDYFMLYNDKSARAYDGAVRHIITTQHFVGTDNWLRFKKVDDREGTEMMHDYFELVPMSVVNSYLPEDKK